MKATSANKRGAPVPSGAPRNWQPGDIGPPPPGGSGCDALCRSASAGGFGPGISHTVFNEAAGKVEDSSEFWHNALDAVMLAEGGVEGLFEAGSLIAGRLAARGAEAAATQAPKLLNAVPKSVLNTANHIFGPKSLAEHQLGPLLEAFGGDAVGATYRLQNAAQALANQGAIRGVFQTTVDVAGQAVTVRGAVIDGVVNLRTAFIP